MVKPSRSCHQGFNPCEIETYDVGRLKPNTRYSRRYPEQQPADGERIPTLDEVISLLKTKCDPDTQLWLEIKTNPEKPDLTPMPDYKHITYNLLKEAHELGLQVFVWTPDSRDDMKRLIKMGVDGIITNRPDIFKAMISKNN